MQRRLRSACSIALALGLSAAGSLAFRAQTRQAQGLPDAPSTLDAGDQPGDVTANPLPIVNGRHYRPPTPSERFRSYERRALGPGAFLGPGIGSAIQFARNRPPGWGQDAAGYGQRFAASFGQNAIQSTVRYGLSAALHEDNRYLICRGCSVKDKLKNALLSDVTARHGANGHRRFSLTGIAAGFSGPLISYTYWYPPDPDYSTARGARTASIGFAVRPGTHFAMELLDGRRIPFTKRHFGDNSPTERETMPVGWKRP